MREPLLWFNGLDGRQGSYLMPPAPPRHPLTWLVAPRSTGRASASFRRGWRGARAKARRGLKEGLDPGKLDEAGWGVIFPSSTDSLGPAGGSALRCSTSGGLRPGNARNASSGLS